jgi:hypothetical protein
MTEAHEHHTDLSVTEARQGRWGRPVFWVLVISTSLAVLAMIGVWIAQSGSLNTVQDKEAARTAQMSGPPPAPSSTPREAPGPT